MAYRALKQASDDSIPTSKIHTHHDYIVPGFTEFAKQLHSDIHIKYYYNTIIIALLLCITKDLKNYRPITQIKIRVSHFHTKINS